METNIHFAVFLCGYRIIFYMVILTWKTNFGTTKICFDVSMAVIAAVLSFVFAGRLDGVREGTVIAALLVGFIARLIGKKLAFLKDMIFPEKRSWMASSNFLLHCRPQLPVSH